MALTARRLQFLRGLATLCRQTHQPVHYAQVAAVLGVSKFTAYDQLRRLLDDGYLAQAYELPASRRAGRSLVLFTPTAWGWQAAAVPGEQGLAPADPPGSPQSSAQPPDASPLPRPTRTMPLDLMDRAVLYKERLRQEVIAQLARVRGRSPAPLAAWPASLTSLQRRLQQAREPLAVATYTLGLWIARGCTQRPHEFSQTARTLLSTPWPRPDLSLAGVISTLAMVVRRPTAQTAAEVRRLQAIVSQVTREEAAWLWQFVQEALRIAQLAPVTPA